MQKPHGYNCKIWKDSAETDAVRVCTQHWKGGGDEEDDGDGDGDGDGDDDDDEEAAIIETRSVA